MRRDKEARWSVKSASARFLLHGAEHSDFLDFPIGRRNDECIRWGGSRCSQRVPCPVALARCYYETGRPNEARATLKDLQSPEGVFLGGQIATKAGDFGTAERMFASIRDTYPDPSSAAFHLALAQFDAHQFREAKRHFVS